MYPVKQNFRLSIPAFLQTLQTDPDSLDLSFFGDEVKDALVIIFAAEGKQNMHLPPEMQTLIAALNSHLSEVHAWARSIPDVEDRSVAFLSARAALKSRHHVVAAVHSPPSLFKQARNLTKAVVAEGKAILKGESRVGAEEHERRLSICFAPCDRLFGNDGDEGRRCAECGCFVKRKSAWRSQSCPLGKW